MDIKKTGFVKQILDLHKKQIPSENSYKNDVSDISKHGKLLSELNNYKKMVLSSPDVREDKVKIAREKLESGAYSSQKVYDALAGNLSKFLESEDR